MSGRPGSVPDRVPGNLAGNLTVRWSKGERTFEPGSVVTIGRDDSADIVVDNRNVSRRHAHVQVRDDGQWLLSDLGSSQGTYVYGARTSEVVIDQHTIVMFGRAPRGEPVDFSVTSRRPA